MGKRADAAKKAGAGWRGLTSSCLRSKRYDPEKETLDVEFKTSGAQYRYFDVPQRRSDKLEDAKSVGKYYNRYVRNDFEFKRLSSGRSRRKGKR